MCPSLRLSLIVYWLALVAWVSAVVAAAVAAVAAFGTLSDMDLTLPMYAAFDPAEHGRLAAGLVVDPVFALTDTVQAVAAGLVALTMVIQFTAGRVPPRTVANMLRIACMVTAVGLLVARLAMVAPAMDRELDAYRLAARSGAIEDARRHRAAFDGLHPTARRLFDASLLALVGLIAASAVSLGPGGAAVACAVGDPERTGTG